MLLLQRYDTTRVDEKSRASKRVDCAVKSASSAVYVDSQRSQIGIEAISRTKPEQK